jgi:hypothetical protein
MVKVSCLNILAYALTIVLFLSFNRPRLSSGRERMERLYWIIYQYPHGSRRRNTAIASQGRYSSYLSRCEAYHLPIFIIASIFSYRFASVMTRHHTRGVFLQVSLEAAEKVSLQDVGLIKLFTLFSLHLPRLFTDHV